MVTTNVVLGTSFAVERRFLVRTLAQQWQHGAAAVGYWLMIPSSVTAEAVAAAGPDFICFDQQHGLIGTPDLVNLLTAVQGFDTAAITRVPSNSFANIGHALDIGCTGVIVPMVESTEEARKAVEACRYPPEGRRSYGPVRASRLHDSTQPADLQAVSCIIMIETAAALDRVRDIVRTPGVDAVYIGPADLAIALGRSPKLGQADDETEKAIEEIRKACNDAGIPVGIQCASGAAAHRRVEQGFELVTIATDLALLAASTRSELAQARTGTDSTAATAGYS